MDEDDLDFTPSQNNSSNLASLFGVGKKSLEGNSSLSYVAPRAPKKESSPNKKQCFEGKGNKGVIICSKTVQAYKLENRIYVSQGRAGLVISGNYESSVYAIILYNQAKEYMANITITKTFALTIPGYNYVSFYDNKKQNWSIMFYSADDIDQFVEKVAISKFYCYPGPSENILIQDLSFTSKIVSNSDSKVEIIYKIFSLNQNNISLINENVKEKIDLSNCSSVLAKGLIGCSENSSRLIIVPHSCGAPWSNDIEPNKNLLFKIKVEKVISQVHNVLVSNDFVEDDAESSLTESSEIKPKASVKNDVSSRKMQKANLISRMAKIGHASFPLKEELRNVSSDSEDDDDPVSPSRFSTFKSRLSGSSAQHSLSQNSHLPQKSGVSHQVVPLSLSSAPSPTADPSFSFYVSESRVQAAELRMNVSKLSDKMDIILNKIQNINTNIFEPKLFASKNQDYNSILASVQNLIAENEKLNTKIEEQKHKIEQQNEKILYLLELNQKYLEQGSNHQQQAINKQLEFQIPLCQESEKFFDKNTISKNDDKKSEEELHNLRSKLKELEDEIQKLRSLNEDLTTELESQKKIIEKDNNEKHAVESYKEKLKRASDIMTVLKDKLKETMLENKNLKSVVGAQKENIVTEKDEFENALKIKTAEYEKTLKNLQSKISEEKSKSDLYIQDLNNSIKNLEEEKKKLLLDFENEKEVQKKESQKIQELLYINLVQSFDKSSSYTSAKILSIIEKCFQNYISPALLKVNENLNLYNEEDIEENSLVQDSSTESIDDFTEMIKEDKIQEKAEKTNNILQQTANAEKESEDTKKNLENKLAEGIKEENYNCNKSYDQRWRTTKPPPPPLFDDEDDEDWLS